MRRNILKSGLAGLSAAVVPGIASAQKRYSAGASDKEIKIGGISPYSGPASSYGTIGKGIKAYFDKVNAEGGVNGRKLNFISYDDGYNPSRTVEMARKLVEQDEVLLIFNVLGTPTNSAIHKYMNQQKVPQLFNATGATKWGEFKDYPWTMGWQPSYLPRPRSMLNTSSRRNRTARLRSSIRTTITVATTSRVSRTAWATKPRR